MIRSMTAFASAEGTSCRGRVLIEMRSVNHRFLEMGLRCPEDLRALEPKLGRRLSGLGGRDTARGGRWRPGSGECGRR